MPEHSHAHLHETKNEHHKGEVHKSHQSVEHPVATAAHPAVHQTDAAAPLQVLYSRLSCLIN